MVQLQKTLGLDQNHSGTHALLGMTYGELGRYPEAVAEIQKNHELKGRDLRGELGRIYALAGQRDKAQKLLAELQEEAKHKPVSPYSTAKIYASLGEKEQAFSWLEKAIAERDGNLTEPGLKVDRVFENLHSDPRFTDLLRRMGLTP
jgi:tetratricopeptide (TPR) repeat protein